LGKTIALVTRYPLELNRWRAVLGRLTAALNYYRANLKMFFAGFWYGSAPQSIGV